MMTRIRSAAMCRWATPTLFVPPPDWLEAERCPWTCVRDAGPVALVTTVACASCPRWELRLTTTLDPRHGLIAVPAVYVQTVNALDLDYVPTGSVDEKPISE